MSVAQGNEMLDCCTCACVVVAGFDSSLGCRNHSHKSQPTFWPLEPVVPSSPMADRVDVTQVVLSIYSPRSDHYCYRSRLHCSGVVNATPKTPLTSCRARQNYKTHLEMHPCLRFLPAAAHARHANRLNSYAGRRQIMLASQDASCTCFKRHAERSPGQLGR
jgi:hypothetical protein